MNSGVRRNTVRTELVVVQRDLFSTQTWVFVGSGASGFFRHDQALRCYRLRANGSFVDSDVKKAPEFLGRSFKFKQ